MPKTSRYDLPPVGLGGELHRFVRDLIQGYANVAGEVAFLNGTTATILEDALFTTTTEVILVPRSAAGAAMPWWLQARDKGRITIGHADPGADLVFGYIAIG